MHPASEVRGSLKDVVTRRLIVEWAKRAQPAMVAGIPATTEWVQRIVGDQDLVVSVVMPTRNRAHVVGAAIDSVLAQRHQRWELVMVDDGSTDTTPKVLAGVVDARVRVVRGPGGGNAAARNLGLAHATGDVVAYLDDDNVMHPLWLQGVAWAFRMFPETETVYGARIVDGTEPLLGAGSTGTPRYQFLPFNRRALRHINYIDLGTIAHRRGAAEARFDESLTQPADWDLILRLTRATDPYPLPLVALYYSTSQPDRLSVDPGATAEAARVSRMHRSASAHPRTW